MLLAAGKEKREVEGDERKQIKELKAYQSHECFSFGDHERI